MNERLESMLRIAQAATKGPWELSDRLGPRDGSEGFYRISAASTLSLEVRPCADGYVPGQNAANAQHIATFNPRTAEALVKVALAAASVTGETQNLGDFSARKRDLAGALSALTAAMEDSNVG